MNIDSTYIKTRTKKIDGKAIKVDTYKLTPFSILLIGGTGTGKSSLLASMFEEMGKNHPDLAFKPDKAADNGATFQNLNFQLKKLYQIVETHELEEYFAIPGGIQGTGGQKEYHFEGTHMIKATFHHKEFIYPVKFVDSPGGWFTDPKGKHDEKIESAFELSQAYIYCIDTPAMMSGDLHHFTKNCCNDIQTWFTEALKKGAFKNKSIIFALSRSEAYRDKPDTLQKELVERYGALITLLKQEGAKVYAVPVYTLGGISFKKYDNNEPMFVKHGPRKSANCEIPLIQLLHDCMTMFEQELHQLNQNIGIIISNSLGITHYDLAEECAKEVKKQMQPKLNPMIWQL